MPDFEGIGTGIGRGLSVAAENLWKREELRRGERDKQAETLHARGVQAIQNLGTLGFGIKNDPQSGPQLLDLKTQQPAQNAPAQAQQLFDTAITSSKQAMSLFPASESGALVQHFRKWMGKQPKPPTPDPRAAENTAGAWAGEVPLKPEYSGESGDFIQLAKLAADPLQTEEARSAASAKLKELGSQGTSDFEKIGEPRLDKASGNYYQTFISKSDPSKQKTVKLPMDFQPTGTEKREEAKPQEDEIAAGARMWAQYGLVPPAKLRSAVEQYMSSHNMAPLAKPEKPDNSPQGRLAKALRDSGKAATPEDANAQAAAMIVDAQKAKEKAATGTSSMNPQELAALAQFDVLSGNRTAFGLGKSGDRDAYNRAKADLLVGGSGQLLTGRADVRATQTALSRLQTVYSQTLVNEQNARKNFALSKQLGQRMDKESIQVAIPLLNEWVRTGEVRLSGNPAVNNFMSNLQNTMTEYAKVVTGQTGGAAVTDSARSEMQQLLNRGLSTDTINDWIDNVAGPDMSNRITSYQETIQGLQEQMKGVGASPASTGIEELEFGPDGKLRPVKK